MLTAIVFILILGILIFVHEAGHFLAARASGVKVEEFAFGFPPRLWSRKVGETTYAINLIPLGGYVKLLGEHDDDSSDPRSFHKAPVWARITVILAGVVMNLVLAVLVLWIGFMIGMSPLVSSPSSFGGQQQSEIVISGIMPDSAAAKAGLKQADGLVGFTTVEDFQKFAHEHIGQSTTIKVRRGSTTIDVPITLGTKADAPVGVALTSVTKVKLPVGKAFRASLTETGKTIVVSASFLKNFFSGLFMRAEVSEGISGPVGIYQVTGISIKLGVSFVLQLLAGLSLSLALFNVLPIPPLDGGGIMLLILEKTIRKKALRESIQNALYLIGLVFVLGLIILATYQDIIRL